jgi:hypothetical protein
MDSNDNVLSIESIGFGDPVAAYRSILDKYLWFSVRGPDHDRDIAELRRLIREAKARRK